VPPWCIAAGRVGSVVQPVRSWPGQLQRPDCQRDCQPQPCDYKRLPAVRKAGPGTQGDRPRASPTAWTAPSRAGRTGWGDIRAGRMAPWMCIPRGPQLTMTSMTWLPWLLAVERTTSCSSRGSGARRRTP
jgi:hypothetical protein